MKLSGISIQNFRSIGEEPVILSPLAKCNILVGKNNVGKSNVIRAVQRICTISGNPSDFPIEDSYQRLSENKFHFTLEFEPDNQDDEKIVQLTETSKFEFEFVWDVTRKPVTISNTFSKLSYPNTSNKMERVNSLLKILTGNQWNNRVDEDVIRKEFSRLGENIFRRLFESTIPRSYIIPEFRKIQEGAEYSYSGNDLIRLLGRYQHPAEGNDKDREKFDRIERFVQILLHLPNAQLEVTHENNKIMLTNNGLRLPLSDYGTGVHQLVILLTAVLSIENSICCIEEPEIHLHPTLQREFIQFIITETSNQYLISTHSPTLINADTNMPSEIAKNLQVFHLELHNGATIGHPILESSSSLYALNDLGVRASDLLQSNSVIWVEGPSDRIYLNCWIKLVDSELIEGLHYTIMFYGGSLLSHLSTERDDIPEELIPLLKINQNAVVVIDSDKPKQGSKLSPNKERVRKECEANKAFCWITHGREIENYLSSRVINQACDGLLGKGCNFPEIGKYDQFEEVLTNALKAARLRNIDYVSNKPKFARLFAGLYQANDLAPELEAQLTKLTEQIRQWNQ